MKQRYKKREGVVSKSQQESDYGDPFSAYREESEIKVEPWIRALQTALHQYVTRNPRQFRTTERRVGQRTIQTVVRATRR